MKPIFSILLLTWLFPLPASLCAEESRGPKLAVVIIVDQLRADSLTLLADRFVDGGFKRLARDGASFTQAHFDYGVTATGPGHASLATGTTPSRHGIVGNQWRNTSEGGRRRYCCGDEKVRNYGLLPDNDSVGRSPCWLEVPTLGDRMKASSQGRSKVWSVSLKDRSAILTSGKRADGAVWWDRDSGHFVSSSFFGPSLPAWAAKLNSEKFADRFFGKTWDRLLSEDAYPSRFFADAAPAGVHGRWHPGEFPKVLGRDLPQPSKAYYRALYLSPFGNDLVFECARRAIEEERLGADEYPDLLNVCLSSNDAVGHRFGPDSHEVIDCTIRTDRQLAEFFDWLDKKVGLERCVVALTADHGVGPIPEYAAGLKEGGGRLNADHIAEIVNTKLAALLGTAPDAHALVSEVMLPWLYLDEAAIKKLGFDVDEVSRLAAGAAERYPGIMQAFASAEMDGPRFAGSNDLGRQIRNSYFSGRSGHVYLHWERYWYADDERAGHGAAYEYDQHVPMLIMGAGVRAGVYARRVCPTGLHGTLCELLGMAAPGGATGEAYREALPAGVLREK